MQSTISKIKRTFCKHTPTKTRIKTVGRGYGSRRVAMPAKGAYCIKCGVAL